MRLSFPRASRARRPTFPIGTLPRRRLPLPGLKAPPEADVREVLNDVNALEYGLKRLETLPVSLRLMRELHERLLAGNAR